MPGPRIKLILDQPFTEMIGEGWGYGKVAGALQFGLRVAAYDSPVTGHHPGGIGPAAQPEGIWKVPGLGVITLKPVLESRGIVNVDDPFYHGWAPSEVDISDNDDGGPGLGLLQIPGTYARTRKASPSALVGLLANVAEGAILATISASLRVVWRTKIALKANEAWAFFIQPVRTFNDNKTFGYMAFLFGKVFSLGIDLHGFATLYENVGTDTTPNWLARKRMDLGGAGLNLRSDFRVQCLPIGGRYLVFRFGNVESVLFGIRPSRYDRLKDFVYDSVTEGGGNYFDAGIDQNVVEQAGKLSIAVQSAGTDYRFTPYKVRYPTDKTYTTLFTPEPMANLLDVAPDIKPYGYAAGYSSGGAGTMTVTLESDVATVWDPSSDTMVVPKLSLTASADGVYTPELWYIEGTAYPKTVTPPWEPYDASAEWYYIRFTRTAELGPGRIEFKLKDDTRYSQLFRRGGPVEIAIDDEPAADGYLNVREPTVGVNFTDAEYNGHDMWERLKVPCGKFPTLDGKKVADIIFSLLRRAGFTDDQISIEDDDLAGITFAEFDKPQDLKLFTYGCTVEDALKDIASRTSVQGADSIRIRFTGGVWRVYFAPAGYADAAAPTTVFYATEAAVPTMTGVDDETRWAHNYFKITSLLEPTQDNPAFNALRAFTSDGEDSGLEVNIAADPNVTTGDSTKQEFEGRLRTGEVGPPTITASSMSELQVEARTYFALETRRALRWGMQAEWQPSVDVDQEIVVLGLNPATRAVVSYGVWRIEEIDTEISTDDLLDPSGAIDPETMETRIIRRAYHWSASYSLTWLRKTPIDYPYPMFSTVIPSTRMYSV